MRLLDAAALPLVGLLADRQQADARVVDAVALAGERGAHLGELHEPLGLALGVGAGVDQDVGVAPGTGMGVAIAGRATPSRRPMRSSAAAMPAPVLPALNTAQALPSRTSSSVRTSELSFFVRTALPGSSSMAMTSDAATTGISADVAERVGLADENNGVPLGRGLPRARRRSQPGALSPPIASMATGSVI